MKPLHKYETKALLSDVHDGNELKRHDQAWHPVGMLLGCCQPPSGIRFSNLGFAAFISSQPIIKSN